MPPAPESLLPLSPPVFHILLSLADADRHGYAIMQEIEERTGGAVRIGPGTLYGAIKRLRDDELIEELVADGEGSDERRRYYHLTALGRKVARLEAERLEELVAAARARLGRAARPA
jgi:DNA-binding PadR family transcriptional regulator